MPQKWIAVPGFKHKVRPSVVAMVEANFIARGYTNSVSGLTAEIARMYCVRNRIDYKVRHYEHSITIAAYFAEDRY